MLYNFNLHIDLHILVLNDRWRLLLDHKLANARIFGKTIVEECNGIMWIINQRLQRLRFLILSARKPVLLASLREHNSLIIIRYHSSIIVYTKHCHDNLLIDTSSGSWPTSQSKREVLWAQIFIRYLISVRVLRLLWKKMIRKLFSSH